MGLYDTFLISPQIPCPACGNPLREDWQTKALNRILETYKVGDRLGERDGIYGPVQDIPIYQWCPDCRQMVDGRAEIRDWVYTGFHLESKVVN